MMATRRLTIVGVGAIALLAAAWLLLGHRTPAGQAALVTLSTENFGEFTAEFNASAGQERIVALLSPT